MDRFLKLSTAQQTFLRGTLIALALIYAAVLISFFVMKSKADKTSDPVEKARLVKTNDTLKIVLFALLGFLLITWIIFTVLPTIYTERYLKRLPAVI
jgi:hypothetical protein